MVTKSKPKKIRSYEGEVVVRGFHFHMAKKQIEKLSERVNSGKPLPCTLVHEADNEFDSNAIMVFGGGYLMDEHIAYIGKPLNIPLKRFLDLKPKVLRCELIELDLEAMEGKLALSLEARE